jgi:hypothetical protein
MSILTPEEQVGFHRQKGMKTLLYAGFFVVFALAYFIWFGPYLRDATGRVNALMYAYYELFGITVGAVVLAGIGVVVAMFSLKHFSNAKRIKDSIGNA